MAETAGDMLVVVPSISAARDGDAYVLDRKAVDGLREYARLWDGPVRCVMRAGPADAIAFGQRYRACDLPFELRIAAAGLPVDPEHLSGAAVVLGSGDHHLDYGLPDRTDAPVVFIVENPLATRLSILRLTHGRSVKTVKSALWSIASERRRRAAFRKAAGLQCNGTPAHDSYAALTRRPLLFFDTRTTAERQIDGPQLEEKKRRVLRAERLRLVFSGRLDPIKGVGDLVPVVDAARRKGADVALDVYGDGPLRAMMEKQVVERGLADHVRLHGAVDFERELIPALIDDADLFLCCHPQADPSCTYLETLACGVPIAGYRNAAFAGVLRLGEVGVATPVGDVRALADAVVALSRDRSAIARMMDAAAAAGRAHSFENEFAERVRHLRQVAADI